MIQIGKPKLSDKELISINLTSEYIVINIDSQLFRVLPLPLFNKIERSVYNRRKGKLFSAQDEIRKKLVNHFHQFEDYFIIDSMPLEVCKLARASRSKICRESFENSSNRGYCAS